MSEDLELETTRLRETVAGLVQREESYRTLAMNLPGLVYRVPVGGDGRLTIFNDMLCLITGYEADELPQGEVSALDRLIVPEDRDAVVSAIRDAITRDVPFDVEYRLTRKDGGLRFVNERGRPVRSPDGSKRSLDSVAFDVTDRWLTETAFRESQERLRLLFENTSDGIIFIDTEGVVRDANPQVVAIAGAAREAVVGKPFLEMASVLGLQTEAVAANFARMLAGGPAQTVVQEVVGAAGRKRVINATMSPVFRREPEIAGFALFVRDVTERHRTEAAQELLQRRLSQFARMESLGLLAGGIAHDFRNHLTIILCSADALDRGLDGASPLRDDLNELKNAADRAAALCRQLNTFGKLESMAPRRVEVNATIRELSKMLKRIVTENIRLTFDLDPAAGRVFTDPSRLEQVIFNLCVNACDAMPGGGSLSVTTKAITIGAGETGLWPGAVPGGHVRIDVTDTGPGITRACQDRIFEPFFTTKPRGRGSGLGLSIVYGIVTQHGGHVEAIGEQGKGTTFSVYLRQWNRGDERAFSPAVAENAVQIGCGGETSVLVVEPDPQFRRLVRRVLASAGHDVTEADCGEKALEVFLEDPSRFDLVISSVVMPGLSGVQLAMHMVKACPGVRVLFMSGYPEDTIGKHVWYESRRQFIQKPFDHHELLEKVADLLSEERGEGSLCKNGERPG